VKVFPNAEAAADAVADVLIAQLSPPGPKGLVVTGGLTPGPVYDRLAQSDLDWGRIAVALSDERFVDPSAPESNERLVRERLLRDSAAAASFIPLKGAGPAPRTDAARAEPRIRALLPFDAVLIGVGEDGHIASLFPGMPGLASALDPTGEKLVIGVAKAGLAPYVPRISLTAAALLDSGLVVLLAGGAAKRAVLERVEADPDYAPPVAALLRQTKTPVQVIWSPDP
jgi:6-phosphogluconolactonase